MSDRAIAIDQFLGATDWHGAERSKLPSDASFRHYVRLSGGPQPALLMDAPPPQEDVRSYMKVARHLRDLGFSAPEIYVADEAQGLLVIEDFGDDTYTRRLAAGADERSLYALAADVLVSLHRSAGVAKINVPIYAEHELIERACLLTEWFVPAVFGRPASSAQIDEYRALWRQALARRDGAPETLALRDFHVDNLMWIAARDGVRRCGLLDFQDAMIAPASYDLVSLVEDARRDIDPGLRDAVIERYLAAFPRQDRDDFAAAMAIMGAQRHARVIGVFSRLWLRDGKPKYLRHIPRVWRLLERSLLHPVLEPLRSWFDSNVPRELRRAPSIQ